VALRPFEPRHRALLERWLREPHVAPWYPHPDENLAWADAPPIGGAHAIIAAAGAEVGYLRWQRVDRATLDRLDLHEIPANSVDADILVGAEGVGSGAGPAALIVLVEQLRADCAVPLVGLTTELANVRAHRAFGKAGFRIARQYRDPRLGLCYLMTVDLRPQRA
jgi:aminoglycoside 6'-N-acetyltransferase